MELPIKLKIFKQLWSNYSQINGKSSYLQIKCDPDVMTYSVDDLVNTEKNFSVIGASSVAYLIFLILLK